MRDDLGEKLKALSQSAQDFWRRAFQFVEDRQTEWFMVKPGSKQYEAWREYFRARGWRPFAIRMLEQGTVKEITMPTEWPEWFESVPQRSV